MLKCTTVTAGDEIYEFYQQKKEIYFLDKYAPFMTITKNIRQDVVNVERCECG